MMRMVEILEFGDQFSTIGRTNVFVSFIPHVLQL